MLKQENLVMWRELGEEERRVLEADMTGEKSNSLFPYLRIQKSSKSRE